MNAKQRGAVFVATLLVAVALGLHSPWTGYETETGGGSLGGMYFESKDLPLSLWRTIDPLVPWFGNVLNFLAVIALVAAVAVVWCYLYRSASENLNR
jgi:hypothetical protein